MPQTTNIDSLIAAITRAETNGATDEDQAKIDLAKALGHDLIDIIGLPKYRAVSLEHSTKVLAGVLGLLVKNSRPLGPISGAIIAADLCQIIMELATDK